METEDTVAETLHELELVLIEEHRALRALDRDTIEKTAERKLVLDSRLRTASPGPKHVEQLQRVRKKALENQLLIVHARACVKSVLSMVSGEPFQPSYPGVKPSRVAPRPLQVDFRG